jgi:FXSXX-COOH protein
MVRLWHETVGEMNAENDKNGKGTFNSDVIDLSDIDLSRLGKVPSQVLRSAIQRVCRELASEGETVAYFQNSLRAAPSEGEAVAPPPDQQG